MSIIANAEHLFYFNIRQFNYTTIGKIQFKISLIHWSNIFSAHIFSSIDKKCQILIFPCRISPCCYQWPVFSTLFILTLLIQSAIHSIWHFSIYIFICYLTFICYCLCLYIPSYSSLDCIHAAAVRKEISDETDRETGRSKQVSTVPIHLSIFSPNGGIWIWALSLSLSPFVYI